MSILKTARTAKQISQKELAVLVGVTPGAISLIETGNRGVRPPLAKKLAEALGLSVEQVLFANEK